MVIDILLMLKIILQHSESLKRFPGETEEVWSQIESTKLGHSSPDDFEWSIMWSETYALLQAVGFKSIFSTALLSPVPDELKTLYKVFKREDGVLVCQFCKNALDMTRKAMGLPGHNWMLINAAVCELCLPHHYLNRINLYAYIRSKTEIPAGFIDALYHFIKYPIDPKLQLKSYFINLIKDSSKLSDGYYLEVLYEGQGPKDNPIGMFKISKELAELWKVRYLRT